MSIQRVLSVFVLCTLMTFAHAEERIMMVLDASGSMWGQLEGKAKIDIARDALKTLVNDWPEGREVGLVAYGHRSKGDCNDIETLMPVAPLDIKKINRTVDALNPKGKTPLSAAVQQAAQALKYTEEKATVVLLSDGRETCDQDPCALGKELEKLGIDFTAHVIGFDVTKTEDQAGLRCLAKNTGGEFILAGNAKELKTALIKTAKAPAPVKEVIEEAPKETTPLPKAELIAPESAIKGTKLQVELKADAKLDGYIYLFPKDKKKYITYGYVRENDIEQGYKPVDIRLPATPGDYTLKWIQKDKRVIAEKALSITDADVSLDAPESATMGTEIAVTLNAPEGLDGYIYLFAKGKDKYLVYGYVQADKTKGYKPVTLRTPATVGEYTLKWITKKDRKVLAEAPLTITEADIALDAPESATMGTEISVNLKAPEGLDGYIYLFAKDKEKHLVYGYVKADKINGYKPVTLRIPAVAGEYTLKWITKKDKKILAEAPLTITEATIGLEVPESVIMGTKIKVKLNAPDGLDGYIYLFAKGKDKYITYGYVKEDAINGYKPVELRLPAMAGDYVVKWTSKKDKKVLAEAPLTITAADISLRAPKQVEKETVFSVKLTAPDGLDGYIYLFPKDKDKYVTYSYIKEDEIKGYKPVTIKLTKETAGDYVLKWLTKRKEVLAERPLQIVDELTE